MLTAQNTQEYYLEIKAGYDLGNVQQSINNDGTISITTDINDFSNFVNSKEAYYFDKAFPGAISPLLQRVYILTLDENEVFTDFMLRNEVKNILLLEKPKLAGFYPNDYIEVVEENLPNTAMDLIKAPLAWTITQGDPNILVGIVDTKFDLNHEDLQGQIVMNLDDGSDTRSHGTGVASMVAAKTNNGKGIASIGFNTKLVTADFYLSSTSRVWQVSQIPGVKVINCSWLNCTYNAYDAEVYAEIASSGVLVVAAAGNARDYLCGGTNNYRYPASYDSTLSVTSVGSRYPIGYYHDLHDDDGNLIWWRSWKDCYAGRPDYGEGGHTRNDKVDVTAPGQLIISATDDYNDYPGGYHLGIGTSASSPIVAGLAALIFSVNPNLAPTEVKNIIKSTADDIYHIPYNQQYIGLLGTGRINAYRAVKTAKCMLNPGGGLDLAMQNSDLDDFTEPDVDTEIVWQSDDIWVRNENDGDYMLTHQNPKYDPGNPNYVYVRVTNNSCVTSSGTDHLKLHWAKASTSLPWPLNWNGDLTIEDPVTGEDILMGDEVGVLDIPVLGPGESKVLEFEWHVPNPADYINIETDGNPWHFCLLARIESLADPMTVTEGLMVADNVRNNNNIVWKNTTVVNILTGIPSFVGASVAVGNPFDTTHSFTLELKKDDDELGKAIYDEAEVSFEMDDVLYNAWQNGGQSATNIDSTYIPKKKIVLNNNAKLDNIQFGPNEIGILNVSFHFLTEELTDKRNYTFYVIQRDAITNEIIGGETYKINKKPRPIFSADAGNDETIGKSESVTISAEQINEAAVYNWYDPEGNLIYTGTDLTVSPNVSKTYRLEIISDTDGYKDYDEVEITVNPYKLESLAPNPASSQVNINYTADEATSAYLMVVSTVTGTSNNYILDINESTINLDISSYPAGLYSVALICDGEIVDSKNLAKQ